MPLANHWQLFVHLVTLKASKVSRTCFKTSAYTFERVLPPPYEYTNIPYETPCEDLHGYCENKSEYTWIKSGVKTVVWRFVFDVFKGYENIIYHCEPIEEHSCVISGQEVPRCLKHCFVARVITLVGNTPFFLVGWKAKLCGKFLSKMTLFFKVFNGFKVHLYFREFKPLSQNELKVHENNLGMLAHPEFSLKFGRRQHVDQK